jgi:hypothetical protein
MANNYCVTSFTLKDSNGKPAALGGLGLHLFTHLPGMEWFEPGTGKGVYEGGADTTYLLDLLTDLLTANDMFDPDLDLAASLKALGGTDDMVELVKRWSTVGCLTIIDLYDLARLEPGASLYSVSITEGWWCDKYRHDEFGGFGTYVSPVVAVSEASNSAPRVGEYLEEALGMDEPGLRAAAVLKSEVLDPILLSMDEDMRADVVQALKGLL